MSLSSRRRGAARQRNAAQRRHDVRALHQHKQCAASPLESGDGERFSLSRRAPTQCADLPQHVLSSRAQRSGAKRSVDLCRLSLRCDAMHCYELIAARRGDVRVRCRYEHYLRSAAPRSARCAERAVALKIRPPNGPRRATFAFASSRGRLFCTIGVGLSALSDRDSGRIGSYRVE